jgi:hypothetical protein
MTVALATGGGGSAVHQNAAPRPGPGRRPVGTKGPLHGYLDRHSAPSHDGTLPDPNRRT